MKELKVSTGRKERKRKMMITVYNINKYIFTILKLRQTVLVNIADIWLVGKIFGRHKILRI